MERAAQHSSLSIHRRIIDEDLDAQSQSFGSGGRGGRGELALVTLAEKQVAAEYCARQKQSAQDSHQQSAAVTSLFFLEGRRVVMQLTQGLHLYLAETSLEKSS